MQDRPVRPAGKFNPKNPDHKAYINGVVRRFNDSVSFMWGRDLCYGVMSSFVAAPTIYCFDLLADSLPFMGLMGVAGALLLRGYYDHEEIKQQHMLKLEEAVACYQWCIAESNLDHKAAFEGVVLKLAGTLLPYVKNFRDIYPEHWDALKKDEAPRAMQLLVQDSHHDVEFVRVKKEYRQMMHGKDKFIRCIKNSTADDVHAARSKYHSKSGQFNRAVGFFNRFAYGQAGEIENEVKELVNPNPEVIHVIKSKW